MNISKNQSTHCSLRVSKTPTVRTVCDVIICFLFLFFSYLTQTMIHYSCLFAFPCYLLMFACNIFSIVFSKLPCFKTNTYKKFEHEKSTTVQDTNNKAANDEINVNPHQMHHPMPSPHKITFQTQTNHIAGFWLLFLSRILQRLID